MVNNGFSVAFFVFKHAAEKCYLQSLPMTRIHSQPTGSESKRAGRASAEEVDRFGGWQEVDLGPSERFRLTRWRGGSWLVTPSGHPVVVVGLCHASLVPFRRKPGDFIEQRFQNDEGRYIADLLAWMKNAGFNTFSYDVPAGAEAAMNCLGDLRLVPEFNKGPQFPDLFDPAWRSETACRIAAEVPRLRQNPRLIGYTLSSPLLFSPVMERPGIWHGGTIKRQNYMMATRSLPAGSAGKRAYVNFLRRTHRTFDSYVHRRGPVPGASSFDDLERVDLSSRDSYETLHPDDAAFYTDMWSDLTRFLVREIRRHDPDGLIFSYRILRIMRWPDPWLDAMLRGVGPHVDAFVPELYGEHPWREVMDGIGEITGKPSLIADGMRLREFVYVDETDDLREGAAYEEMFTSLLASKWFLGGCLCEYQGGQMRTQSYPPRAHVARSGIRNPDFTERGPLHTCFKRLHGTKHRLRLGALRQVRGVALSSRVRGASGSFAPATRRESGSRAAGNKRAGRRPTTAPVQRSSPSSLRPGHSSGRAPPADSARARRR